MIDCEHGPMSLDEVERMVRAAEVFGITPITRIPDHEDSTILRFLDRGVQGIIVPYVNAREDADAVARAARYWPDGHRGMAGGRAHVGGNSPTDAAGIAQFIKLGANLVTISALGFLRLGADDFRRRVQAALQPVGVVPAGTTAQGAVRRRARGPAGGRVGAGSTISGAR
jgi:HpcH/HpaI aldolase/citrate lyase family protein